MKINLKYNVSLSSSSSSLLHKISTHSTIQKGYNEMFHIIFDYNYANSW